jgi:hypothetical protein
MVESSILFAVIYLLNCVPAFAPPTWMALSFIGFNDPTINVLLLALIGAAAATLGRLTLAKLSRLIIRRHLMDDTKIANIDAIKDVLEKRRILTGGVFLFYAFSPLPSNFLFIAYGLTPLKLRLIALPFFVGRFISYYFWVFGARVMARHLLLEYPDTASYLDIYFLVSQVFFLALIYAFTKIDWHALLKQRKLRWM